VLDLGTTVSLPRTIEASNLDGLMEQLANFFLFKNIFQSNSPNPCEKSFKVFWQKKG